MSAPQARATFWRTLAAFDAEGTAAKRAALARLAREPLPGGATLVRYHDALLFLCAHPADAALRRRAEAELRRIGRAVHARGARLPGAWQGQGLPFGRTVTRFSHDLLRWLCAQDGVRVSLAAAGEPRMTLAEVLAPLLPAPERAVVEPCNSDADVWRALGVPPARRLAFLIDRFARLDRQPLVKDRLFDALDLFVRVESTRFDFSKAGNRLPMRALVCQRDRLGAFDARALLDQALPAPRRLSRAARAEVAGVIRRALVLTDRETDPSTHMDEATLRVFDLERGVSVALHALRSERQLPLESYVGYMLFKNGLPAAYGGAWVFGRRALFGINIFEPFRGGESAWLMAQLLRVYRQQFGVSCFEVEAYQFGQGNPEGIATGAFWFYHRLGFRPLDAALARLAAREHERVRTQPGYRSSPATLRRLAGSNMALDLARPRPRPVQHFLDRIAAWLRHAHGGDRRAAVAASVAALGGASTPAFEEAALLAAALGVRDEPRLALLRAMAQAKPVDPCRYQQALLAFLESSSAR